MTGLQSFGTGAKPDGWTSTERPRVLPDRVRATIEDVARRHGVGMHDILSESRRRYVAVARFEACDALSRLEYGSTREHPSLIQIARWVGFRDHTSALHAIRRHAELRFPWNAAAAVYQGRAWL